MGSLRNDSHGADSGVRHWCVGQFRGVSAHVHRSVNCGYSVWRAFGNISCCSFICLLPETFAVDKTSKQIITRNLTLVLHHFYHTDVIFHTWIYLVCHPFRVTMQGGYLNLIMWKWTTTKATVSSTAERRLRLAPLMTKYCYPRQV